MQFCKPWAGFLFYICFETLFKPLKFFIMKRPTAKVFVGIGLCLFIIVWALASTPPEWVRTGDAAWILVRLIAAVLGAVIGFLTFTSGNIVDGIAEIKDEVKELTGAQEKKLTKAGYSWLDRFFIRTPLVAWILCWVIAFEIMVSFYIADWCKGGF